MFRGLLLDMQLYWHLVRMQLRSQLQYKVETIVDVLTYFLLTCLEFAAMLLYFVPFPSLLGWQPGEVALLSAITSLGFGLAELFGGGIDNFDEIIRRGDFDGMLLRPVASLIQVGTTKFRLRRLGRITQGGCAFFCALFFLRGPVITWSLAKVLILLAGVLSSALIFISILLLGATVCFWTVETTELTNILTYGAREMLSYPLVIYHQMLQRFFVYIVPLAFGTYIPVCYVLGRSLPFALPDWLAFVSPLIALLFALVASLAWRVGVHHYQSTGS